MFLVHFPCTRGEKTCKLQSVIESISGGSRCDIRQVNNYNGSLSEFLADIGDLLAAFKIFRETLDDVQDLSRGISLVTVMILDVSKLLSNVVKVVSESS